MEALKIHEVNKRLEGTIQNCKEGWYLKKQKQKERDCPGSRMAEGEQC